MRDRPSPAPRSKLAFPGFNRAFEAVLARYTTVVRVLVRRVAVVLVLFLCLVGATIFGFLRLPSAFLPEEIKDTSLSTCSCRPPRRSPAPAK